MVDMDDRMMSLYNDWLLDTFPDEIHTDDDLFDAVENKMYFDEFCVEVFKWMIE